MTTISCDIVPQTNHMCLMYVDPEEGYGGMDPLHTQTNIHTCAEAQWLSGRVLDSRPRGSGFEPDRRHCVVVLEQDTFILA